MTQLNMKPPRSAVAQLRQSIRQADKALVQLTGRSLLIAAPAALPLVLDHAHGHGPALIEPRTVKLDADGNQLPDTSTDHAIVFYPALDLYIAREFTPIDSQQKGIEFAKSLRFLGSDRWALGTPQEQLIGIDYSRTEPALDNNLYPNAPTSGRIWTEQVLASSSDCAFSVGLGYGFVNSVHRPLSGFARPVLRVSPGQ